MIVLAFFFYNLALGGYGSPFFFYNLPIGGFQITRESETNFSLCSSSAENLQKITLYGNLNTLAPNHAT